MVALAVGGAPIITKSSPSDTLDSVVASVGHDAITLSDVEQEYRFERFLDGQWPVPPPTMEMLSAARERLTYQVLLVREENPGPAEQAASEKSATDQLVALRQEYGRSGDFQRVLKDLGITEPQVLAKITQQDLMLLIIDQRLRPSASPSDDDVAAYYQSTFVPEFQKRNAGKTEPPLATVDSQIREILVQKRINELLNQWIEELQPTSGLRFHIF